MTLPIHTDDSNTVQQAPKNCTNHDASIPQSITECRRHSFDENFAGNSRLSDGNFHRRRSESYSLSSFRRNMGKSISFHKGGSDSNSASTSEYESNVLLDDENNQEDNNNSDNDDENSSDDNNTGLSLTIRRAASEDIIVDNDDIIDIHNDENIIIRRDSPPRRRSDFTNNNRRSSIIIDQMRWNFLGRVPDLNVPTCSPFWRFHTCFWVLSVLIVGGAWFFLMIGATSLTRKDRNYWFNVCIHLLIALITWGHLFFLPERLIITMAVIRQGGCCLGGTHSKSRTDHACGDGDVCSDGGGCSRPSHEEERVLSDSRTIVSTSTNTLTPSSERITYYDEPQQSPEPYAVGIDPQSYKTRIIFYHIPWSHRLIICLTALSSTACQFTNQAYRIIYRSFEAQRSHFWETKGFFIASFAFMILHRIHINYQCKKLRRANPPGTFRFDPIMNYVGKEDYTKRELWEKIKRDLCAKCHRHSGVEDAVDEECG